METLRNTMSSPCEGEGTLVVMLPSSAPHESLLRLWEQDLWLKMHSSASFANEQGELSRLLAKYRLATLEILERVEEHPALETIADAFSRRKVR